MPKSPLKPAALPVLASTSRPPALSEDARLDQNLKLLFTAMEDADGVMTEEKYFDMLEAASPGKGLSMPPRDEALATVRAMLPGLADLRAAWRIADQPASRDQIATEVLKLTTTLPQAGNINQEILSRTLCEDIAELRPAAWVLARACHAHRTTAEFLSFQKLFEEIRRAERQAARYREMLEVDFAARVSELADEIAARKTRAIEFNKRKGGRGR